MRCYGMDFGIIHFRSKTVGGVPASEGFRYRPNRQGRKAVGNNKRAKVAF
jgi:hypothetical protein